MMPIKDLSCLVRQVVDAIEISSPGDCDRLVQPLRDAGIIRRCHEGISTVFFENDHRLRIEWYAGQIIDIVEGEQWFAMNSIINCLDKFVPEIQEEDSLS